MRAPAGSSHCRTSHSKSSEGGETERRRKPVAGSIHSGCSPCATRAGGARSISASSLDMVRPCAPARRPSTDAVGLTSPFSIREREARLTSLSAESSSSDHRLARRNSRSRWARRRSAELRDGACASIYGKILSQMRTSRRRGYKPAERLRNASPRTRGRPICPRRLGVHYAASSQRNAPMSVSHHASIPAWTWTVPVLASGMLALKFAHVVPSDATLVLIVSGLLLGATVFAAVHHAEVLALKLGEPFGSILLAVAVTVIEVGLIVSIMFAGAEGSDRVARDTVFAAVMIVLNGVVGLCLVMGAGKHFEQTFQLQGASSALAVLGTLATLALILPNFTETTVGPSYSILQLEVIGVEALLLWGVFVFVQTIKHRDYFLDMEGTADSAEAPHEIPSARTALLSLVLLLISLAAVVLLAKVLSYPVDAGIAAAGLPKSFVGVVIALIVLLPEGLAATKSALVNRLQNSINLALGSAIASIGLTIPTVAVVSLAFGQRIALGISPIDITLLVLTLYISALTLGTGRTTVLQGAVHLVIFAAFLLVSAVP